MHGVARSLDLLRSQRVRIWGNPGGRTIVFGHGFGWSQEMWRLVAPSFMAQHTVVLFDHIGAAGTDPDRYDVDRYSSLRGYADDLVELIDSLGLEDVVYVGHSVSAMIGALAAARRPSAFDGLVLLSPSPRYVDDIDYRGGFGLDEVRGLVEAIHTDASGWARTMAPHIVGNPDQGWIAEEMIAGFAALDRTVAGHVARAIFLGDYRAELAAIGTPTLIVQAADDLVVPPEVAQYLHARIRNSRLVEVAGTGHATNLSSPGEIIAAIAGFLPTVA